CTILSHTMAVMALSTLSASAAPAFGGSKLWALPTLQPNPSFYQFLLAKVVECLSSTHVHASQGSFGSVHQITSPATLASSAVIKTYSDDPNDPETEKEIKTEQDNLKRIQQLWLGKTLCHTDTFLKANDQERVALKVTAEKIVEEEYVRLFKAFKVLHEDLSEPNLLWEESGGQLTAVHLVDWQVATTKYKDVEMDDAFTITPEIEKDVRENEFYINLPTTTGEDGCGKWYSK
ncbi:hypothetical protein DL96DRAFT_1582093, partial [Flagelloscypha sp. PMI_526]